MLISGLLPELRDVMNDIVRINIEVLLLVGAYNLLTMILCTLQSIDNTLSLNY